MATATSAFPTYTAIGNREDLENMIYDVSPSDTPFMSLIGRGNAKATLHEWQMDKLAAPAANQVIEGEDATTDATTPTQRLKNQTTISDKVPMITGTQEAVDKAGRRSEMAYQLMKRAKELKTDIDLMASQNTVKTVGTTSAARKTAGFETWIFDDQSSFGAGGADTAGLGATDNQPDDDVTRADGTQRIFTEDLLKAVLAALYTTGGNPTSVILGAFNKQKASSFAGYSTRQDRGEDKRVTAAIDYYVSDFGEVRFIPSRQVRTRSALVVDPEFWSIDYLRPFKTTDLAKTGDHERKQLLAEWTLTAKNPTSSGLVADLTTS